jgi:hypothetical protein
MDFKNARDSEVIDLRDDAQDTGKILSGKENATERDSEVIDLRDDPQDTGKILSDEERVLSDEERDDATKAILMAIKKSGVCVPHIGVASDLLENHFDAKERIEDKEDDKEIINPKSKAALAFNIERKLRKEKAEIEEKKAQKAKYKAIKDKLDRIQRDAYRSMLALLDGVEGLNFAITPGGPGKLKGQVDEGKRALRVFCNQPVRRSKGYSSSSSSVGSKRPREDDVEEPVSKRTKVSSESDTDSE